MSYDFLPFLKDLIQLPGLSGYEAPVRQRISAEWEPLVDEIEISRVGSLHALKRGNGKGSRPCILLAAHMDAIGLMVTEVTDGFLRLTAIGGVDARILPGQSVTVHGRQDLPGLIFIPPPSCLPEDRSEEPFALGNLLVDLGLPPRRVARLVRPGDTISFSQPPIMLGENKLAGHSLDNQASVAALTVCLRELQTRDHLWDLFAVATTQEEETFAGAKTSAFAIRPNVAVAIDVTFGHSPGLAEYKTYPLNKGPTNGWGPSIHPAIFQAIKESAERAEIPLTIEIMPVRTDTDADALHITAEGIPTGVVSIPLRYMHTPVEVVSLTDIRRTGRLLAAFVAELEMGFIEQITWE
jgi:endoglucanase